MLMHVSFLPGFILTDLKILAIDAAHVAVAEEDSAGPAAAGERRFFTVMGTDRRNDRQIAGTAKTFFVLQAVDPATVRANIAGRQTGFQLSARFCSSPESINKARYPGSDSVHLRFIVPYSKAGAQLLDAPVVILV